MNSLFKLSAIALLTASLVGCSDSETSGNPWDLDESPDAANNGAVDAGPQLDATPQPDAPQPDAGPEPDAAPDVAPDAGPIECQTLGSFRVGESVEGELDAGRGQVDETTCSTAAGVEQAYWLEVETRTGVRIWTQWEGDETLFSPVLTLSRDCSTDSEIACSDPLTNKPEGLNGLIRTTLDPGRYLLRVDERDNRGFANGGSYIVRTEAIDLAENSSCEGAQLVDPTGDSLTVEPTNRSAFGGVSACFGELNYARFYAVDVPAGHTATAVAEHPGLDGTPLVRIGSSCGSESCDISYYHNDSQGLARLSNTSEQETRFYIAVENYREEPFTLDVDVEPMAPNASCEGAEALTPGAPAVEVDWARGLGNAEMCNGDRRTKLFYTVDVPANHRLFTYGGDSGRGPRVDLRESCAAASCIEERFVNGGDTAEQIVVEAIGGGVESDALRVETIELADNAECEAPRLVEIGETLPNQQIRSGGDLYNPCNLVTTRDDVFTLFYRVDVPLGRGPVAVRAESRDPQNTSISMQAFSAGSPSLCGDPGAQPAPICRATDDAYFRNTPNAEILLDGSSGGGRNPAPVLVAVSMSAAYGDGSGAAFDLVVEWEQGN